MLSIQVSWTSLDVNPKQRGRHSAEFKAKVLAACAEPGASVAADALSLRHAARRGQKIPLVAAF